MKSTEEFIEESKLIHGNKFDYSVTEYRGYSNKLTIICPIHGEFTTFPNNHLIGSDCMECFKIKRGKSLRKTQQEFLEEAIRIHSNTYDYSQAVYITKKSKLKISCKIHGIFEQQAYAHLRGQGCKKCAQGFNTFRKDEWIKKAKSREGIFYIIRCFNDRESFYKLGITYKSIKIRYRPSMMPYDYEIIKEVKSKDLNYIWELENLNKKIITNYRYKPQLYFEGSIYECFLDLNLLKLHSVDNLPIKKKENGH